MKIYAEGGKDFQAALKLMGVQAYKPDNEQGVVIAESRECLKKGVKDAVCLRTRE
jgi:hypothetical protein